MSIGPNAGSAHITVKPSLRGWSADVRRQLKRELGDLPPLELPAPKMPAPDPGKSKESGRKAGDDFAGGFDRSVRKRITAALDALPPARIGAATNEAEQKIRDLRAELETLSKKKIGVDVDAAAAVARLAELQAQLGVLSDTAANVQVKADTVLAATQLAAIQAEVDALDRDDVNIKVDVDKSGSAALAGLSAAAGGFLSKVQLLALLGTALLPIGAVITGLTASLTAALVAGGAGIGVLLASVLGNILPVIKAQSELKQKQQEAASAASAYATAQNQVKSAAAGVAQAEVSASRAISDAERAVASARMNAARQTASAEQALADARRNAARSTASAEQAVADAQARSRDAMVALSEARDAARAKLAAYAMQLRGAAIDEAGAALSVTQAQEQLNAVLSDPTATQLQIDQSRQALDEARFNYDESSKRRKDLRKQAAEDRKAGVSGDKGVIDAKQRLAQANVDVQRSELALAQTRADGARSVAAAEKGLAQARADGARSVADAERNLDRARVDGATQVAAAHRQLAQAQQAAAEAGKRNADAQAEVAKRMAKLDGPAAVFVAALARAKKAWKDFTSATAGSSFGLAAKALDLFTRLLPRLAPLARIAARAVGILLDDFARFATGKEGQGFLRFLRQHARGAIVGFGRAVGNIAVGLGHLVGLFSGVGGSVGGLAKRFANFGRTAGRNSTVQKFLDYIHRTAPLVRDALAAIAGALVAIVTAAGPIGSLVLKAITGLARAIASIDPGVLQAIAVGFLAYKVAAIYATGVTTVLGIAAGIAAGEVTLLEIALGIIPIAIAALVVGLVIAYKKVGWFHKAVNAAWSAIKTSTVFLWKRVFVPAFKAIAGIVQWAWTKMIKPYLRLWVRYYTDVLFPVIRFLWSRVVKPIFRLVGDFIQGAWKRFIRPVFQAIVWQLKTYVFPVLRALWDKVIRPVFGWIGDKISNTWTRAIRPALVAFRDFIRQDLVPAVRRGMDRLAVIWDTLKKAAGTPVKFVVDTVYNNGLRKVINAIPGVDPVGPVDTSKWPSFARGGVLPGWTPGRDVHRFVSPTAGVLNLSGGEGILIPEATRAIGGEKGISFLNRLAKVGRLSLRPFLEQSHRSGGVVYVDGEPMSRVAAAQLAVAENASGMPMRVIQGSYQPYTSYSGSSHMGGGVMDTAPGSFAAQSWLRKVAFAAWARNIPGAADAGTGAHVHSVSLIDPMVTNTSQQASYRAGGDGLGGADYGPRPAISTTLLAKVKSLVGSAAFSGGSLDVAGTHGGNPLTKFLNAIDKIKDFAKAVPDMLSKLKGMGAWGKLLLGGVRTMGGKFRNWVNDKVPGPGPLPGVFDLGGLARGRGYLTKDTLSPERVLSPAQTAAFERQVATLDNWDRTARALAATGAHGAGPLQLEVSRFRIVDWDKGLAEMDVMATSAAEHVLAAHSSHAARINDLDVDY